MIRVHVCYHDYQMILMDLSLKNTKKNSRNLSRFNTINILKLLLMSLFQPVLITFFIQ